MGLLIENLLIDLVLLFFPLAIIYREKGFLGKKALEELGFRKIGLLELLKKTLVILLSMLVLSFLVVSTATAIQKNDLGMVRDTIDKVYQASPLVLAYLLTVRVFSEEVFFRGFLVQRMGPIGASLVFGLGHVFFGSVVEVIGAFILGLVLAVFFQKNKNIFPNLIAHFIYNMFALVVFFGATG